VIGEQSLRGGALTAAPADAAVLTLVDRATIAVPPLVWLDHPSNVQSKEKASINLLRPYEFKVYRAP
jgi:hypothetical protein